MKWSWKITRLAGIDIYIHATFFLLVAWFGFHYWQTFGTPAAALDGMLYVVALFTCVVLHELGHSLTARRYGIVTRSITLLPIGGVAAMDRLPEDPLQEIKVALAGPAVNVVIAALLWLWLNLNAVVVTQDELLATGGPFAFRLMVMNIFLMLFNLLPAFPMDGGRVLRAVFALRMEHHRATARAAAIGQNFALVLGLLGLFYNPVLVLIAVFLWFGANAENQLEQLRTSLATSTAGGAMMTEFHILSPHDTLTRAIELTLAGSQKDFPVGTLHGLQGVLTQNDLLLALQKQGEQIQVGELPLRPLKTVPVDIPIQQLLEEIQSDDSHILAVSRNDRIVGLVNLDNVVEMMRIHQALDSRRNLRA